MRQESQKKEPNTAYKRYAVNDVSIRRQEREKQIDKELDDAFEKESDAI